MVEFVTAQEKEGLYRIRQRRRLFWLLFFALIPAFVLCNFITRSDIVIRWFMGIYAAALIIFGLLASFSHCPHCGHHFHINKWGVSNPWTKRCLNCGLSFSEL